MSFTLRDYQVKVIDEVRAHMKNGVKSILVQLPTGGGKTAIATFMLGTAQAKRIDCGFLVHRRELVKQTADTFELVNVPYYVVSPNFTPPRNSYLYREDARIQVGSVQTIVRRLNKMNPYGFISWDEAHHCTAGTWKKIRNANAEAFHVGFTATPWRLDGSGLRDYFEVMVQGPTPAWLIEHGYLSQYDMYGPPGISTKGIKTEMGDYAKDELARAADRPTVTGDILKYYMQYARGKRALGFGVSVEHSKHMAQQFNLKGIPAAHVDGETATEIRDGVFADLASGKLLVVFNVDLAGEGFDCPAVECVILACPTQSLTKYLQQVGRALRPSPGKDRAIILDHAGNWAEHGLPDKDKYGQDRVWTLDGRDKKPKDTEQDNYLMKKCPKCFRVQHNFTKHCKFCGSEFDVRSREVDFVDGELVHVGSSGTETFDGPPAPTGPKKVGDMNEKELEEYFKKKGYPRPKLLARSVAIQRATKNWGHGG